MTTIWGLRIEKESPLIVYPTDLLLPSAPKPAILALIRQILAVAGTALVAKGFVQASKVEPVVGAVLTIGSVVDKRGRAQ